MRKYRVRRREGYSSRDSTSRPEWVCVLLLADVVVEECLEQQIGIPIVRPNWWKSLPQRRHHAETDGDGRTR
jgi:hypothetical protein